jgi:Mrp family chromosome partitioning ATPase
MFCRLGLHRVNSATVWNGDVGFSRCIRCNCEMVRRPGAPWQEVPRGYTVVWRPKTVDGSQRDWHNAANSRLDKVRAMNPGHRAVAAPAFVGAPYEAEDAGEVQPAPLAEVEPRTTSADFNERDSRIDWEAAFGSAAKPSAKPSFHSRMSEYALGSIRWLRGTANRSLSRPAPPREQASRTYRYLVQRIAAKAAGNEPVRTVLVSAVCDSDAANDTMLLLSAMMQDELGGRLLVIDATLRDAGIGTLLGARGKPGLSEAHVSDPQSLLELLRPLSRKSLFLLGPGLNPAESRPEDMAGILALLAQHFDHVLIQQHAITTDTRYLALAARVDLILVLAEEGQSRMASLAQCRDAFLSNGIGNVGLILTVPSTEPDRQAQGVAHAS